MCLGMLEEVFGRLLRGGLGGRDRDGDGDGGGGEEGKGKGVGELVC